MCRPDGSLKAPVTVAKPATPETRKDSVLSGFDRRKSLFEAGLLSLSAIYGCVYYLKPDIPVADSYCDGEEECRRPDLVAYKVTALAAMTTMGLMGIYNWHINPKVRQLKNTSPEDRLFGNLAAADYQNVVILCYQVWDFCVAFTIPEHIDPIFMVHHVLAMITAYCSLEYQMVPYYSIFYGGCSEFSSIFLVFLDKDQMFAVTPGSFYDQWLLVCKVMFFLTFSYYRIFGWIYYSFPLWRDCQRVIKSGTSETHRPGKAYFLRLFQGLDLVLGALQCYWYSEILKAAVVVVSGG